MQSAPKTVCLLLVVLSYLSLSFSFPDRKVIAEERSRQDDTEYHDGIAVVDNAAPRVSKDVQLEIVVVRASIPFEGENRVGERNFPPSLSSIRGLLTAVPYRSFQMIENRALQISLKQKKRLAIGDSQLLLIRPLYIRDDRLCLWLKWKDQRGMSVLDSRMHIELGQSMVAGVEGEGNNALILAIRVVGQSEIGH